MSLPIIAFPSVVKTVLVYIKMQNIEAVSNAALKLTVIPTNIKTPTTNVSNNLPKFCFIIFKRIW